jgi:hypothetical protein
MAEYTGKLRYIDSSNGKITVGNKVFEVQPGLMKTIGKKYALNDYVLIEHEGPWAKSIVLKRAVAKEWQ